jgi:23S rRNA (cytidine1920-2'-O)/16S rRNA (cytidine1409-2'-O)-methyltransferase
LRLDIALVESGLARSRNQAASLIESDRVLVNSKPARKSSQPVVPSDKLQVLEAQDYVSRAGHKLAKALDNFAELPIVGKVALDIGASTGGFTDVLLRRGAKLVYAIDVGHDQLVAELRENRNVICVEGFNARELSQQSLTESIQVARPGSQLQTIDLVVADLSFISLTLVLEQALATAPTADFVLLIKPQFEVGKQSLSAHGIVNDHRLRAGAIHQVVDCADKLGMGIRGLRQSELAGTHGNIEYVIWLSANEARNSASWNDTIDSLAKEG